MFAVMPDSERLHRVRFKRAVRVVPLESGPPRAYRVLANNLSRQGMFLQMPVPFFAEGTQLALSLEAAGRVLPFARAEVVWRRPGEQPVGGGLGVRFTSFLHPRAHELVQYLVDNLDRGVPLPAPRFARWKQVVFSAALGVAALVLGLGLASGLKSLRHALADSSASTEAIAVPPERLSAEIEAAAPVELPAAVGGKVVLPAMALTGASVVADAEIELPVLPVVPLGPALATGSMPLPRSAVRALGWKQMARALQLDLAVAVGSEWKTVFMLRSPSRLVIDLNGEAPAKSYVLGSGSVPYLKAVRLGRIGRTGTRLVIDFAVPPTRFEQAGAQLLVQFAGPAR